jgi:hypothetical protein
MQTLKNESVRLIIFAFIVVPFISNSLFAGLEDRAFATHNVGKVGFFTTNIGQFYPYGGQFERTLEYPINSGHICMYRQCLMIGVPVNVISAADGRYEEFDAIGGYNAGDANIAISDNPATWPSWGWPIQDDEGNPVFTAQQETYCVYSDSTNWRYYNNDEQDMLLDLEIHQTIYSWGVPDADKFHVLKFELINTSNRDLEEMYFNFYSDLDIGGIDNAAREWADDCVALDLEKELVYFYDSDNYSNNWETPDPFLAGVTFLQTPNGEGITDFHWIDVTIDEVRVNAAFWDSLSYYLMKSDTMYFHNHPDLEVDDYFHLGDDPIDGTHYDDPATSRIMDGDVVVGGPMVAYIVNGPFDIVAGESAEIIVAVMVGDTEEDLLAVTDKIWEYYLDDFRIPVVPAPNIVDAKPGNKQSTLIWDNDLDINYINNQAVPPANDLEGYIIYRTTDKTLVDWTAIDTVEMRFKGDTTYNSRAYEYTDSDEVYNGFDYIYNVSAYRTKTGNITEESIRVADINNITNLINAVMIQPTSDAAATVDDLDKIKVVPNPFVVSARWDETRLGNMAFGEPVRNIAFTNLPRGSTVRIFTVDGDLVQTLQHIDEGGRLEWNLLSSENIPVVSGIYFYHVDSSLGEKAGRFAIIR